MKLARSFAAILIVFVSQSLYAGSASGGFHTSLNGSPINIEFNATATDSNGGGTGQMNFKADVDLPDVDEDDPFGVKGSQTLSMKVDFDCVSINGKNAAMSGIVQSASVTGFAGQRVILAVEDGGEGAKADPDKFTWGVYGVQRIKWFPTDAELEFDNGWKLSWTATDAEREDDRGIVIRHGDEQTVDCRSFPVAAYALEELGQGTGNIQVRP